MEMHCPLRRLVGEEMGVSGAAAEEGDGAGGEAGEGNRGISSRAGKETKQ